MPETKQLFSSPRCQHVHYNGKPCKAPARRGRNYCVFHQAAHFDAGGCVLPIVEDLHSYHLAIIRIARALADDIIDPRKATALLYAMQLVGAKLEAFSDERKTVEDPVASLKKEISARYDARRYPFPTHVPEKDLLAILKQILTDAPAEPNDAIEQIPQEPLAVAPAAAPAEPCALRPEPGTSHPEADSERSEEEPQGSMHFPPQSIDPSDLRPPQDDSAGGISFGSEGAA